MRLVRSFAAAILGWGGSGALADSVAMAPDRAEIDQCLAFIEAAPGPTQEPRIRILSDNTACLDGSFDRDNVDALLDWSARSAAADAQKALVARSGGGDTRTAIEIAENLNAAGGVSLIRDVCGSSCANYLYAGIVERGIIGRAAVLFHGGHTPQLRAQMLESLEALLEANSALIDDPDAEISRNSERFDQTESRQNALLDAAGASRSIIYDYDRVELDEIDDRLCTGAPGTPRWFVFFAQDHAERLGLAPASGALITDLGELDALITRLGLTFSACQAPEGSDMFHRSAVRSARLGDPQ